MRRLALAITFIALTATCAGGGRHSASPPVLPPPPATVASDATPQRAVAPAPIAPASPAEPPSVRFIAVGDLALSWSVGHGIEHGFDPFADVHSAITQADIAFANLETVLSALVPETQAPGTYPPLIVGPPGAARSIASAGFDIVSVANNHAMDLHANGLRGTLGWLASAGVASVGGGDDLASARRPFVRCVRGVCVGMLAFAYGTNERPNGSARIAILGPDAVAAVRALRPRVDVLLVSVHWGIEMTHSPRADQVELAHALVDAGADAIIGHHPHVLQSVEIYRARPIVYSLGNFVFGPMPAGRQASAMFEMELTRGPNPVSRAAFLPVRLTGPRGAPQRAEGSEGDSIRQLLRDASASFDTRWTERDGLLEPILSSPSSIAN